MPTAAQYKPTLLKVEGEDIEALCTRVADQAGLHFLRFDPDIIVFSPLVPRLRPGYNSPQPVSEQVYEDSVLGVRPGLQSVFLEFLRSLTLEHLIALFRDGTDLPLASLTEQELQHLVNFVRAMDSTTAQNLEKAWQEIRTQPSTHGSNFVSFSPLEWPANVLNPGGVIQKELWHIEGSGWPDPKSKWTPENRWLSFAELLPLLYKGNKRLEVYVAPSLRDARIFVGGEQVGCHKLALAFAFIFSPKIVQLDTVIYWGLSAERRMAESVAEMIRKKFQRPFNRYMTFADASAVQSVLTSKGISNASLVEGYLMVRTKGVCECLIALTQTTEHPPPEYSR